MVGNPEDVRGWKLQDGARSNLGWKQLTQGSTDKGSNRGRGSEREIGLSINVQRYRGAIGEGELFENQRFDITVTENASNTRADINKRTSGALNYDTYLRIPSGTTPVMVVTNGAYYVPSPSDYDTNTGRVHVHGPLTAAAVINSIVVTYGNNDYNGDGIPDSWALQYGFSPLDPNVANADPDGDGFTNLQEFLAGTNPNNSASALRITTIAREGNNIRVTWKGGGGTTNMLQLANPTVNSYSTNYADLPPQVVLPCCAGTDMTTNQVDSNGATNVPARFYRVRLVP